MVRVSNFIVGFLNCCSLLAGLVAIAAALFFYIHGGSHCQTTLANPLFVTGIVLVVVSLLGLTGSCCKVNFVLCLYLVVLFLLIVGVSVFTIFCVLITNESAGKTFSNIGIKGLKTWDFNNWLHDHFVKGENWNEIRSCLKDSKVCSQQHNGFDIRISDILHINMSPIQVILSIRIACILRHYYYICDFIYIAMFLVWLLQATVWVWSQEPERYSSGNRKQQRLQDMEQSRTDALLRLQCM